MSGVRGMVRGDESIAYLLWRAGLRQASALQLQLSLASTLKLKLQAQAQVLSDVDDRVPKHFFASGRRIHVPPSTGCRSEEGLKEMAVMEETATWTLDLAP